jgi:molybdopterin molybdotransferase
VSGLLSVDEALDAILTRARPLDAEDVAAGDASGRVLAADARAVVDLPPFPSSAMDGFAVRAADTPGKLTVVERIAAGRPARRELAAGEAMAIATGGVVPDGADAVVPIEVVVETDNSVEIPQPAQPAAHVRPRGGDIRTGETVLAAGTRLGSAQLGAAAAAGIDVLRCTRRPRAAVLTTGTELRTPGQPLAPGQVYEANGPMLSAALVSAGADVELLPAVPDDAELHRSALERALQMDLVVTSGGVSVGPHDLVRAVERELGVEEVFWRVAVKPGKPLAFGVRDRTLVFGLPGNPVSTLVCFEVFVRPALRALQGERDPRPRYLLGELAAPVRRNAERDEFVRARSRLVDDRVLLEPVAGQESHMIARAATADALVLAPRGEGELEAGSGVRFLSLS